MPRYFFDIRDGTDIPDDVGTELRDLDAARAAAVTFAGEQLRDVSGKFWHGHDWKIEVRDETRQILFTLVFSAIEPAPVGPSGIPIPAP